MKENDSFESRPLEPYKNKLWMDNANMSWLASTITFYRNLEKFKFPGKLDSERGKQIVSLVSKELLSMKELSHAILYKAEEFTSLEKEFLVEHFLTSQSFTQATGGAAFILDDSGEFMVTFNLKNHIHFELVDTKGDLENSWNRLVKIESELGKRMNYSYSPKYGFLTADPTICGTALTAVIFLQLSGLIHTDKIDDILEKLGEDNLMITGIQGSPTEIIGDVIAIQNNYTLGVTEENIISSIRNFATKILVEEHSTRNQIRKEQTSEIKDKIARAYGILVHSYQIEAVEALNAISLLKLGIDLGWVVGTTVEHLNRLFFTCRRAHLLSQYKQKIEQADVPHKRSEFIHTTLKNVTLNI
jgi:protein arginine kinase